MNWALYFWRDDGPNGRSKTFGHANAVIVHAELLDENGVMHAGDALVVTVE